MDAARSLFASRGYLASTVEEILARAEISRGSFYHHFEDKAAVFRAIYIETHQWIATEATAAGERAPDAWAALLASFDRYFEVVSDPAIRRLLYEEARTVLDRGTWIETDRRYGGAVVQRFLDDAMSAGELPPRPQPQTALMLSGAVDYLVEWAAEQADPADALKAAKGTFLALLHDLKAVREPSS